jgi:hypothetical protein
LSNWESGNAKESLSTAGDAAACAKRLTVIRKRASLLYSQSSAGWKWALDRFRNGGNCSWDRVYELQANTLAHPSEVLYWFTNKPSLRHPDSLFRCGGVLEATDDRWDWNQYTHPEPNPEPEPQEAAAVELQPRVRAATEREAELEVELVKRSGEPCRCIRCRPFEHSLRLEVQRAQGQGRQGAHLSKCIAFLNKTRGGGGGGGGGEGAGGKAAAPALAPALAPASGGARATGAAQDPIVLSPVLGPALRADLPGDLANRLHEGRSPLARRSLLPRHENDVLLPHPLLHKKYLLKLRKVVESTVRRAAGASYFKGGISYSQVELDGSHTSNPGSAFQFAQAHADAVSDLHAPGWTPEHHEEGALCGPLCLCCKAEAAKDDRRKHSADRVQGAKCEICVIVGKLQTCVETADEKLHGIHWVEDQHDSPTCPGCEFCPQDEESDPCARPAHACEWCQGSCGCGVCASTKDPFPFLKHGVYGNYPYGIKPCELVGRTRRGPQPDPAFRQARAVAREQWPFREHEAAGERARGRDAHAQHRPAAPGGFSLKRRHSCIAEGGASREAGEAGPASNAAFQRSYNVFSKSAHGKAWSETGHHPDVPCGVRTGTKGTHAIVCPCCRAANNIGAQSSQCTVCSHLIALLSQVQGERAVSRLRRELEVSRLEDQSSGPAPSREADVGGEGESVGTVGQLASGTSAAATALESRSDTVEQAGIEHALQSSRLEALSSRVRHSAAGAVKPLLVQLLRIAADADLAAAPDGGGGGGGGGGGEGGEGEGGGGGGGEGEGEGEGEGRPASVIALDQVEEWLEAAAAVTQATPDPAAELPTSPAASAASSGRTLAFSDGPASPTPDPAAEPPTSPAASAASSGRTLAFGDGPASPTPSLGELGDNVRVVFATEASYSAGAGAAASAVAVLQGTAWQVPTPVTPGARPRREDIRAYVRAGWERIFHSGFLSHGVPAARGGSYGGAPACRPPKCNVVDWQTSSSAFVRQHAVFQAHWCFWLHGGDCKAAENHFCACCLSARIACGRSCRNTSSCSICDRLFQCKAVHPTISVEEDNPRGVEDTDDGYRNHPFVRFDLRQLTAQEAFEYRTQTWPNGVDLYADSPVVSWGSWQEAVPDIVPGTHIRICVGGLFGGAPVVHQFPRGELDELYWEVGMMRTRTRTSPRPRPRTHAHNVTHTLERCACHTHNGTLCCFQDFEVTYRDVLQSYRGHTRFGARARG